MIHSAERLCGHAKATASGPYLARRGAFQAGSSVQEYVSGMFF